MKKIDLFAAFLVGGGNSGKSELTHSFCPHTHRRLSPFFAAAAAAFLVAAAPCSLVSCSGDDADEADVPVIADTKSAAVPSDIRSLLLQCGWTVRSASQRLGMCLLDVKHSAPVSLSFSADSLTFATSESVILFSPDGTQQATTRQALRAYAYTIGTGIITIDNQSFTVSASSTAVTLENDDWMIVLEKH